MQLARFNKASARFLIGAAGFICSACAFSQALLMSVRPLYDNLAPGTGVVPIEVNLSNTGQDARGVVQVQTGNFSMSYPVELPQGTRKRIITYPDCGEYMSEPLTFDLITNHGKLHQLLPPNYTGGTSQVVVGEVAENGGDLAFLRTISQKQNDYEHIVPQDAYVKPAEAPNRPVGYQRFQMMVLGDGAERLSDDSVSALKTWALGGGTIVFVGGASSPVINDTRWADLLPIRNARPQNLNGSVSLEKLYGSSPPPFTAMVGEPVTGAYARAKNLIVEKQIGLGRALYLAFNPFENPLNNWNGRSKLFMELTSPGIAAGPISVLSSVAGYDSSESYGRYGYPGRYGSYPPSGYPYGAQVDANNPFTAKLPETSKVLLILFLYFLAVVPINFIVLRKLKRGELAWATAPLLSLAFAGVFFEAAQGLYSAQLSTSSQGVLVLQKGETNGLIVGYTQLFFPRGGTYDLKLKGVDSLSGGSNFSPYSYRSQHSIYEDLNAADTGEIQSSISVPNLAFREIRYRERMQSQDWFDVQRLPNGHFEVRNKSPFKVADARLAGGGGWVGVGDLAAGATKEVAFSGGVSTPGDFAGRVGMMLNRSRSLALTGVIRDLRVGPEIGKEVSATAGVNLCFMSNERLRENEILRDQF